MGTVIITGANSSLALPAVSYLLSNYRPSTVILTVRNDSNEDENTKKLREVIDQSPRHANVMMRKLDLASLHGVHKFAGGVRSEIAAGQIPPIVAAIWNAMSWTLHGGLQLTTDGYERSMAVNHIAHFALTLELLGSFDPERGRIVFLGSDSHEKSALQEFPSILPEDLDLLVHPASDKEEETVGRGFQRYGLSKLVTTMTMYELNRKLAIEGRKVSALAVDPGGLLDSRAFSGPDIPPQWTRKIYIANLLQPVLRFLNPALRRCTDAAKDVIDLAIGPQYANQCGYFIMDKKAESSKASQNEEMQGLLWAKSLEWAGLSQDDTVLPL